VPEFGSLLIETGRNYKLCFDNTFSLFTKKEIKYSYKLVPVENTTRKENDEVKIKNATKLEEEKENKRQIISWTDRCELKILNCQMKIENFKNFYDILSNNYQIKD